jgi:photosystem II stability/assembly factor-like uncharacterized protein
MAVACCCPLAAVGVIPPSTAAPPDATWLQLRTPVEGLDRPVVALAVDPGNSQVLLVGTGDGTIYRSTDGGATWTPTRSGDGHAVAALAFNQFKPGAVTAGLVGEGALRSGDGGQSWAPVGGLERLTARAFAFGKNIWTVGTERGVYTSKDGTTWLAGGLPQLSVSALAMAAVNDPVRIVAGADASRGNEAVPAYQSPDAGGSWSPLQLPQSASTLVATVAAGPLPPQRDVRPLFMGTNAGLFTSTDNGATWVQVKAAELPAADFTQVAFTANHFDRLYVASDGGASDRGGLWVTNDGGQSFRSLQVPVASVSALAVTQDETPIVYVATFRPLDHAVMLWAYRDTGGPPVVPQLAPASPPPAATTPKVAPPPRDWWRALLLGPEAPFLFIGMGALAVLFLAMVSYARGGRVR